MKIDFKMFAFLISLCLAFGIGAFAVASKANVTAKNQSYLIESLEKELSSLAEEQSSLASNYEDYTAKSAEPTATPRTEYYEVTTYEKEKTGYVTADAPMFAYPSTSGSITETVYKDTKITVTAESGSFVLAVIDDETHGWIDKSFFKEGEKKEEKATATPKPTATAESTETPIISSFTYDETSGFTVKYKSNKTSFDGFEVKILDESGKQVCYKQTTPKTTSITLNSSDIKANTKYTVQVKTFKTENGTKKYSAYASKELTTPKASENSEKSK